MDSAVILREVGNVLVWWAALVGTASVVVHLRVFDPSSKMSKHLLFYMAMIAIVLDLGVIRLVLGDSPLFQAIRLAAFVGVVLAMTQRLWLQLKAQRSDRIERRDSQDTSQ